MAPSKKRAINEQDKINFAKGVKFSKENQPSPEAKKKGQRKYWQEVKENEKSADILNRLLLKVITNKAGEQMTQKEAMLYGVLVKAIKEHDLKAVELILKLIGDLDNKLTLDSNVINITVADKEHQKMLEDL